MKQPASSNRSWGPSLLGRRLLSVFLVLHLSSMVASLAKDHEIGQRLRIVTAPYERFLGIWQQWGMFAPPPNGSSSLAITGFDAEGASFERSALVGELEPDRFHWFYDRSLKLERSTFSPGSSRARALRTSYGRWICREAEEEGIRLDRVELWKHRVLHPGPAERSMNPDGRRITTRVDLQTVSCEEVQP